MPGWFFVEPPEGESKQEFHDRMVIAQVKSMAFFSALVLLSAGLAYACIWLLE